MKLKAIFFDLDDTLFDTYGQLVANASRESCQMMIQEGLQADLETCVKKRQELYLKIPRKNLYHGLVSFFGVTRNSPEHIAKVGEKAFLEREVESNIQLFAGARSLLQELQSKYDLYLVTAGEPKTQKQKVKHLELTPFFRKIYYVDTRKGETKKQVFSEAMSENFYKPQACLSVGNRIDHEIAEAKDLGMHTCYVKHGQYVYLTPQRPQEIPDFTIDKIRDLISTCRL
jgi:FMN phosphatase YigB (HAD superfamily)